MSIMILLSTAQTTFTTESNADNIIIRGPYSNMLNLVYLFCNRAIITKRLL